ncbi:hypothetical protein UlMin_026462 [Ulmus minor]
MDLKISLKDLQFAQKRQFKLLDSQSKSNGGRTYYKNSQGYQRSQGQGSNSASHQNFYSRNRGRSSRGGQAGRNNNNNNRPQCQLLSYDNKSMHLCHTKYISDLLDRNDMQDCKPAKTPGVVGKSLSQYDGDLFKDPTKYRSVVGALQYVTLTRPDISFAVNKACQFMQSPTSAHWLAVKRILRYLRGTMQDGIKLQASDHLQIQAYTDADYASTPDDRRSSSGYCLYMGENLVSWSATKQKVVSRSSAESEYRGLAIATAEIVWTLFLLQELCVPQQQTPILWYDNVSASYMASNPVFHARSKHIEIDLHFVRDQIK